MKIILLSLESTSNETLGSCIKCTRLYCKEAQTFVSDVNDSKFEHILCILLTYHNQIYATDMTIEYSPYITFHYGIQFLIFHDPVSSE